MTLAYQLPIRRFVALCGLVDAIYGRNTKFDVVEIEENFVWIVAQEEQKVKITC